MTEIVYSTFKMLFMRGFTSETQQSITISIGPFHALALPTQVSSKWHRQSRGVTKNWCAGINPRCFCFFLFFFLNHKSWGSIHKSLLGMSQYSLAKCGLFPMQYISRKGHFLISYFQATNSSMSLSFSKRLTHPYGMFFSSTHCPLCDKLFYALFPAEILSLLPNA